MALLGFVYAICLSNFMTVSYLWFPAITPRWTYRLSTHLNSIAHTSLHENKSPEIRACELWVQRIVVGYNLCPWADEILQLNKLKFTEFTNDLSSPSVLSTKLFNSDNNDIYDILLECHDFVIKEAQLLNNPDSNYSTTIIVLPNIKKFQLYLDLVDKIQSTFETTSLSNDIQIATFHPNYKFENTKSTQVENYTNRSPYAMIHLLRVNDVYSAIEQYKGQTQMVYEKNIKLMNSIGLENMKLMLKEIINDANNNSKSDD